MFNKINRRGFLGYLAGILAVPCLIPSEPNIEETLNKVLDEYKPLYLSKELTNDMRNWGVDHIDEVTRTIIIKG